MRKNRKHLDDETEVDMTPMLDIVFIMLIFFIVTTSFVKEDAISIERPTQNKQKNKDEDRIKKGPIVIKISQSDRIEINSRIIDAKAVRANVESERAQNPDGIVIIKAHPEASTGIVVGAYDQAKSAGAEKVTVTKAES